MRDSEKLHRTASSSAETSQREIGKRSAIDAAPVAHAGPGRTTLVQAEAPQAFARGTDVHALLRRADDHGGVDAHAPAVDAALEKRGGGQPLPPAILRAMEAELGVELGGVRIHFDAVANEAAHAVHAQAFTVGDDIYFASGTYAPGTPAGRNLIAHELAHVAQYRQGRISGGRGREVSQPGDTLEHEADAVASRAAARIEHAHPAADHAPVAKVGASAAVGQSHGLPTHASAAASHARAPHAAGHVMRKAAPEASEATQRRGVRKGQLPQLTLVHDDATRDALHQAAQYKATSGAQLADGRGALHAATQASTAQVQSAIGSVAQHPLGARADALNAQHGAEHAAAQTGAHAQAAAAQARAHTTIAHATAAPAHPLVAAGPGPSAHDGVDGIQFKQIADWSKYMPRAMPGQDAHESARILKVVQARVEAKRHDSAQQLAGLKHAHLQSAASVRATKGGLTAQVTGAQGGAIGKVSGAEAAQAVAVQAHVASAQAQVRAQAAGDKGRVSSAHAITVAQISASAQAATQKVEQARSTALARLTTQEATQHGVVTSTFNDAKHQILDLGGKKAGEARALGDTIGLDYDGEKLDAARDAAHQVAGKYADQMPVEADKAAADLGSHEGDAQQGVTELTNQIRAKLEDAYAKATQCISQTQQQSLQAADHVHQTALQQIDRTMSTTLAKLTAFGAQSVAGIHQRGAAAKMGIQQAGHAASASVSAAADSAAAGIAKGAHDLEANAREIDGTDPEATQRKVQQAGGQLRTGQAAAVAGLHGQASTACTGITGQASGAAQGMATSASQASQHADQVAAGAKQSMAQQATGAQQSLAKVADSTKQQLDKVVESTQEGFTACADAQLKAFSEVTGKLQAGLASNVNQARDSFNQAVPGKESDDIRKQAKDAADAVKPWWQKALAFVAAILVVIVIVIAVAALEVFTAGAGTVLLFAAAGALAAVLSKMASNVVLQNGVMDGVTWQTATIGAVAAVATMGASSVANIGIDALAVAGDGAFAGVLLEGGTGVATSIGTSVLSNVFGDVYANALVQLQLPSKQDFLGDIVLGLLPEDPATAVADPSFATHTPYPVDVEVPHVSIGPVTVPTVEVPSIPMPAPLNVAEDPGASPAPAQPAPQPYTPSQSAPAQPAPQPYTPQSAPPTGTTTTTTTQPAAPAPAPQPAHSAPAQPASQPAQSTPPTGTTTTTTPTTSRRSASPAIATAAPSHDVHAGTAPTAATAQAPAAPGSPASAAAPATVASAPAASVPAPVAPIVSVATAPAAAAKKAADAHGQPALPRLDLTKPAQVAPAAPPAPAAAAPAPVRKPAQPALANASQAGYPNPRPEVAARAIAKLRANQHPTAADVRDTLANHRGLALLAKLDAAMQPEQRIAFHHALAERMAGYVEGTGDLERDVHETQATLRNKEAHK